MANYVCMYGYVNKQNCRIWGKPMAQIRFLVLTLSGTVVNDFWFQQDAESCHTSYVKTDLLRLTFDSLQETAI